MSVRPQGKRNPPHLKWRVKFCVAVINSLTLILLAAIWFVPVENAPRIENLRDGSRQFVLKTRRESLTGPAVLMVIVALGATAYLALSRQSPRHSVSVELQGIERFVARGCFCVVAGSGVLAIAAILFLGIVWEPLVFVRVIRFERSSVILKSLCWSWSLPHEEIVDVQLRNQRIRIRGWRTDLQLIIRVLGPPPREFRCAPRSYRDDDPHLMSDVVVMNQARTELLVPRQIEQ